MVRRVAGAAIPLEHLWNQEKNPGNISTSELQSSYQELQVESR